MATSSPCNAKECLCKTGPKPLFSPNSFDYASHCCTSSRFQDQHRVMLTHSSAILPVISHQMSGEFWAISAQKRARASGPPDF